MITKSLLLNHFFINVGKHLAESKNFQVFATSTSVSIESPLHFNIWRQSAPDSDLKSKKNIKRNKAPDPDGISAHSLAIAGPSAAAALSTVFKFCSANNCIPTSWKKAKMNAIFKKAVKRKFLITGPYHFYLFPASFLTAECVILSMSTSLIAMLKTGINGVSVKGLSIQSMLISMTEEWKQALGNGLCVGAVFIDFQKSFDTVSHPVI